MATMAHTRAKNRAISDIIGTGEVSAEEMMTSGNGPTGNNGNNGKANNKQNNKQNTNPNGSSKPQGIPSKYAGKCKVCGKSWEKGATIHIHDNRWCCDLQCKAPDMTTGTQAQGGQEALNDTKPTELQLTILANLGYRGPPPPTLMDARMVIKELQREQGHPDHVTSPILPKKTATTKTTTKTTTTTPTKEAKSTKEVKKAKKIEEDGE